VSKTSTFETAGRESHDLALAEHRFAARSDLDACMPSAADAFWLWAADVSEDDWDAAERAFAAGWQDAIDAL
jgi:hypothetical protein